MSDRERKLVGLLRDAIAMLYWHQKKPMSANSWTLWIIDVHTVLSEIGPHAAIDLGDL